jgi:hypothetical protein
MVRRIAAAALAAALAGAAHAQAPAAQTGAAEPPMAEAKTEAARLIAEAKAADLFEDASTGTVPGARHLRSGLVCSFEPGAEANAIAVLDEGVAARGDDVACTTQVLGVTTTLYATRYSRPVSVREAVDDAIRGIAAQFPGAREYAGRTANADVDPRTPGAATRERARVEVMIEGQPALAKVDVAEVNGWIIKLRATGPLEPPLATDLFAEIAFAAVLDQMGAVISSSRP